MTLKHPKAKGTRLENEIVAIFKKLGWNATRSWCSDGRSLGLPKEVDVSASCNCVEDCVTSTDEPKHSPLWLQCKSVSKLSEKYKPSDSIDATIFKENRGEKYIMLKLDDFIKRFL